MRIITGPGKDREPIIPPGGGIRFGLLVFLILAGVGLNSLLRGMFSTPPRPLAPSWIREHAAECVLTSDPESCAIAWGWRPDASPQSRRQ